MHLFDNCLTLLPDSVGSHLYANLMDPTDPNPTAGLTAVPAMSGVTDPSLCKSGHTSVFGISLAPPLPPFPSLK